MPALALLLGLAGATTLGTSAYTFRATFANPKAEVPRFGPFSLTTWEIITGVGMMALLGPVGAAVGAGLAAGGAVSWHDTSVVQKGLAEFARTMVTQAPTPQLPGPAPVAPVAPVAPANAGTPNAPGAPSFWQAPGQAVRDLWSSMWSSPSPSPAPVPGN